MNRLLIASAIGLAATVAYATDQHVGDSSEYYQSAINDQGPGGATHDHGDNTVQNFVLHGHDTPIADQSASPEKEGVVQVHDHGDNTLRNFIAHEHK